MEWTPLNAPEQIEQIIQLSHQIPCVIFKHSTRCSISTIAEHRLKGEWNWTPDEIRTFHLDVIRDRDVSNLVSERFGVQHESPQMLLIHKGECIYHTSHMDISAGDLRRRLELDLSESE